MLMQLDGTNLIISLQPKDGKPEILIIQNVTYDDEGWYTCIAGNSLGTTYASAYLRVVDRKYT